MKQPDYDALSKLPVEINIYAEPEPQILEIRKMLDTKCPDGENQILDQIAERLFYETYNDQYGESYRWDRINEVWLSLDN